MTPTIRAALEQLVELEDTASTNGADPDMAAWNNAIAASREALEAEPKGEGPSLDDVDELCAEFGFDLDDQGEGLEILHGMITAAITRWGTPATPPAPAPASEAGEAPTPIPVSQRLPNPSTKVLAHYCNKSGKWRTICAIWVPAKTRVSNIDAEDDLDTEYDEETDQFYWPEGWYEVIDNWEEFGYIKVYEGEVAYWEPLPKWPRSAVLSAPEAEGIQS